MTSHELARKLLAGPDQEILIDTCNGMETITDAIVETNKTVFHHVWESGSEKRFPEFKKYRKERNEYYKKHGFDSQNDNSPIYKGTRYGLFKEQNNEPAVILVSDSIGLS